MLLVIDPDGVGLVVVLLLFAGCLRIAGEQGNDLAVGRGLVVFDVDVDRLGFGRCCIFPRRDGVGCGGFVDRRGDLQVIGARFAGLHGQAVKLGVLSAMGKK